MWSALRRFGEEADSHLHRHRPREAVEAARATASPLPSIISRSRVVEGAAAQSLQFAEVTQDLSPPRYMQATTLSPGTIQYPSSAMTDMGASTSPAENTSYNCWMTTP
jgi:hypothetical protein